MSHGAPISLPIAALALWVLAGAGVEARAGLASSELGAIGVAPPPGARLPLQSHWRDEHGVVVPLREATGGRPTALIFADFTCTTLCSPALGLVAEALAQSGLRPGTDYRLVVLGLDARDGATEARELKQARVPESLAAAAPFLSADEATIRQVADALGYRFAYDSEHDQFAHPEAVIMLTPDGRIARVLSALGVSPGDLRLALVEAGEGRLETLTDRVRLLCYGFDPRIGAYTLSIYRGLMAASAFTVIALTAAIGWMSLRASERHGGCDAGDTAEPDESKA